MNERTLTKVPLAEKNPCCDAPVVEISVLLESSLLPELESAALDQGRSAGALIRRLIRDFLDCSQGDPPAIRDAADAPRPWSAIV